MKGLVIPVLINLAVVLIFPEMLVTKNLRQKDLEGKTVDILREKPLQKTSLQGVSWKAHCTNCRSKVTNSEVTAHHEQHRV